MAAGSIFPQTVVFTVTVLLLEPRHLEQDYASQRFLKTKGSQSFLCKRTNKIQGSAMQPLKTLKVFEPT